MADVEHPAGGGGARTVITTHHHHHHSHLLKDIRISIKILNQDSCVRIVTPGGFIRWWWWPEAATDASWLRGMIWSAGPTTRFLLHHLLYTLGLAGLLLGGIFGRMIGALFSPAGLAGTQYETLTTRNCSIFLSLGGI